MNSKEQLDLLKTKMENLNFKFECMQSDITLIKQVLSSDDFLGAIKKISKAKISKE